MLIKKLF